MSQRPLIGITGRRRSAGNIAGIPKAMAGLDIDLFFAGYADYVELAGGIGVYLTQDGDPEVLKRLDGLVLAGGADLDPMLYGAEPDPNLGLIERERDERELQLLDEAAKSDMPVFGICRGIQVLNVHSGGTLHQHVADHDRQDQSGDREIHRVRLEEGSLAAKLYGPEIGVNSLHHQAVNQLGNGLRAVGWSEGGSSMDGIVEAIESNDGRLLGVQWHPEMMPRLDPGFGWLVEKAAK